VEYLLEFGFIYNVLLNHSNFHILLILLVLLVIVQHIDQNHSRVIIQCLFQCFKNFIHLIIILFLPYLLFRYYLIFNYHVILYKYI
jgi:hypothetical protein